MISFEMKIIELFRLGDGRTALVGPIEGNDEFIRPCRCEWLIDGVPRLVIQIEGETMTTAVHRWDIVLSQLGMLSRWTGSCCPGRNAF